jgi:thiol-disulfide isomerase/thioredoxin
MTNARALVSLLGFALLALPGQGADGDRSIVHLQLNRNVPAWSGMTVDFSQTRDETLIAAPGTVRTGKAPGALVSAQTIAEKPGWYRLEIRSGEGDPVVVVLAPSDPVRVEIPRPGGPLPYRLTLNPKAGPSNSPHEMIFLAPDYRAEGTFQTGSCRALLAVWDMTADGVFNRRDFHQGSAVGIDLDGDGKLSGRQEFITGGEVFQFCGKSFYVDPDSLEPDGSAVTVVETSLQGVKTGAPIPSFVLETTDGDILHSGNWKGKVALLDFWASWCGYCIEGFSTLKEMQKTFAPDMQIVSIDTDEPNAMAAARKVLREHDLPWPKVMSGKGLADPVWMMAQSVEQRSLPLYVLIGRDGVVRYSGSGGDQLADLRAAIQKLIPGVGIDPGH